jgi:hypothetical protein
MWGEREGRRNGEEGVEEKERVRMTCGVYDE